MSAKEIDSHFSSLTFAWLCSLLSEARGSFGSLFVHESSRRQIGFPCTSFRVIVAPAVIASGVPYPARPENGRTGTDCKSGTHAFATIALVGSERLFWFFTLVCTEQPP